MDDAEIAKALLVNGNICPIVLNVEGEPTVIERLEQVDYNSFEPRYVFKVEIDFKTASYEEVARIRDAPKEGTIFTSWHIKNQDVNRSDAEYLIYDKYKIYKSELINSYIKGDRYVTIPEFDSPFEKPNEFGMVKQKIVALEGKMMITVEENIARAILPGIDKIYFVPRDVL